MTSESTAPTAHPLAPDDRAVGPFAALLVLVALAVLYVGMIVLNVAINRLLGESGTDDSQTFVIAAWASGPDIVLSILAIAVTWLACRWAGGASWRRQCGLYMPMAKPAALWTAGLLVGVGVYAWLLSATRTSLLSEGQIIHWSSIPRQAWPICFPLFALVGPLWEELLARGFFYTSWTACWHGRRCPPPPPGPWQPLGAAAWCTGIIAPAALALIPQWGEIFHHWPYLIWFVVLRVYLAVCRRYVNSLWLCYFLRVVAEVVFWGLTVKYLLWDGGDALWLQIRPGD